MRANTNDIDLGSTYTTVHVIMKAVTLQIDRIVHISS